MSANIGRQRKKTFDQPYTIRNTVEWVQSGRKYFDLLESLIDNSNYEVHLQTYIFSSDETGSRIADALIRAAIRKVQVFVLVDAYGSQGMHGNDIRRMTDAGINFRKYGELYSHGSFHIGRRLHQKVTVIDGFVSLVGGINLSDHYNTLHARAAWLDFAVLMKGDISRRLQYYCRKKWSGRKFTFKVDRTMLQGGRHDKIIGYVPIRIRRNDFLWNRNEITITYREAFRQAAKSILVVGGYFLPGGRTRRLMISAIKRGVSINVIVPERSDVRLIIFARRYLYAWLIRNGIGVYEYKPANVHGKVLIVDNKWTSIGSYDLNNLSAFSNIELNVDIQHEGFAFDLANHITAIMKNDCRSISADNQYEKLGVFARIKMWFAYRFVKTLFVLSVILAGKKERGF